MAPESAVSDSKAIAGIANSFGSTVQSVFEQFGIKAEFNKAAMGSPEAAAGCRIASVLSIIGPSLSGTITILMKEDSFNSVVPTMSYGMAPPDIDNEIAQSVMAETSNMIAGNAGMKLESLGIEGYNISPPQIITGKSLMATSSGSSSVQTIAMPFNITVAGNLFANGMMLVIAFKIRHKTTPAA